MRKVAGLASGMGHEERAALSRETVSITRKILASIDKKARREIEKAFRK